MNRRNFLQALAAAGIATAVPLKLISETVAPYEFTRCDPELFDWGKTIGLCVSMNAGGHRVMHALAMPTMQWKAMTRGQKEATWRRIEDMTLRSARSRGLV